METIRMGRLRTGAVYGLVTKGMVFGAIPLCVLFGALASVGLIDLYWSGETVVGVKALLVSPVMGGLFAVLGIAIYGSVMAFGLWVYSFVRPLDLEYLPTDSPNSADRK